MKHRVSKGLFCLILAGAMLLAGCSGGAENASEEQLPVNASESSDLQKVLPSSDQESGAAATDESQSSDPEGTEPAALPDDVPVMTEEKGILDTALFEDRLACYFFKSGSNWSSAEEGEHGGDSVLFIVPDGTVVLYDCNLPNNGAYIAYALQQLGIKKIDYFINSHPHIDHLGGFSIISRYVDIGEVILADIPTVEEGLNTPYYRKMMEIIEEKNIGVTRVLEGTTLKLGAMTGKVFNPAAGFDPNKANYNESSLVIRFSWKDASFLLGGDAGNNEKLGQKTETIIVEKYGDELKSDIAKLNHHGEPSTQSQSKGWLDHVQARLYVGCLSNIPNDVEYFRLLKETMERGAELMHTGIDGTVLITTDGGGTYDVYSDKDRTIDYYGVLDMDENRHMHID